MISLGFEKKIAKIALNVIDATIGKKFTMIYKLTDIFQQQQNTDKKVKELELEIQAIKTYLKDITNE